MEHSDRQNSLRKPNNFSQQIEMEASTFGISNQELKNRPAEVGISVDKTDTSRLIEDIINVTETPTEFIVKVSVPDTDALIPAHSLTDQEAAHRLKKRYELNDSTPMLPRSIEQKLNFKVGQKRLGVTFTIPVDKQTFTIMHPKIQRKAVINLHQMSFESANKALDSDDNDVSRMLQRAYVCAMGMKSARRAMLTPLQQSLSIFYEDLPNPNRPQINNSKSAMMVHEFMIAANTIAGNILLNHNIPGIYKNQVVMINPQDEIDIIHAVAELQRNPDHQEIKNLYELLKPLMRDTNFGTIPRGMYILGAPAYAQVTNPLRDYVSNANQRNILAHLSGSQPPHSEYELSQVSRDLNDLQDHRRDNATYEADNTRAITIAKSDSYTNLDPLTFKKTTDTLLKTGKISSNFLEEFSSRLKSGSLDLSFIASILARTIGLSAYNSLRWSIMEWVTQHPVFIPNLYKQINPKWKNDQIDIDSIQLNHQIAYLSASTRYGDAKTKGYGVNKKIATQFATLKLLENITGGITPQWPEDYLEIDDSEVAVTPELEKIIMSNLTDRNNILFNYCLDHQLQPPEIARETVPVPGHPEGQKVQIRIQLPHRIITSREYIGASYKEAIEFACEDIIRQIPLITTFKTIMVDGVPIVARDSMFHKALTKFVKEKKLNLPVYENVQLDDSRHQTTVSIYYKDKLWHATAIADDKNLSIRQAAYELLRQIQTSALSPELDV